MAFLRKAGSILRHSTGRQINSEICGPNPSIYQILRCMSSSKVFIGGLSYSTDDQSLSEAFNKYGQVYEARVITDRETGRSRGFGFVTYNSPEEASAAIQALDGQELHGRRVRVNYATEKPRGGGFSFGGGYGAGGGGGFGGNYNQGYNQGGGSYNQGYNQGGGNYNQGEGNYNQGVGTFGGNYSQESNFDIGSGGGFGTEKQGFAVGRETDNFINSDTGANSSGFDGDNNDIGAFGQDDMIEGRDEDNEPDDYAKRA